jgi:2-oxoglutarate ferredoxin oxidoreductase subunit beta
VARAIDTDQRQLPEVLRRAHQHKGASFVEIFQNCIVYNDAVFAGFTDKPVAADNQIRPEQDQPLIFGAQCNKGLRLKPGRLELEVVTLGEDGITEQDLLIHDQTNHIQATLLAAMTPPHYPVALGVLYCDPAPSYDEQIHGQSAQPGTQTTVADLNALLRKGNTWTVGS